MIRNPAVAGQFYPLSEEILSEQVKNFTEKNAEKQNAIGALVPHAGYIYSGRIAGKVFSRIKNADSFVILGPNHTGIGRDFSIVKEGIWRTPLGEVKIDNLLAREILMRSKNISEDLSAHTYEHSIEVQLPFLQFLFKNFQFVPITIRHYIPEKNFIAICEEIGKAIANAIKNVHEKVVIVASSDLTHYESQKSANEKDKIALNAILELNPEKLFREVKAREISMCGFGPAAIMLFACRELGAKNSMLIDYKTSGDVTHEYEQVVGYGGALIY